MRTRPQVPRHSPGYPGLAAVTKLLAGASLSVALMLPACAKKGADAPALLKGGEGSDAQPADPPKAASPKPDPRKTDTDGDGIMDWDDRCPKQKGPKHGAGCPRPVRRGKIRSPRHILERKTPVPPIKK